MSLEGELGYLFSNFGVPTAFAIMMYVMYDKSTKWWQEQSITQDKRHEEQNIKQNERHQTLTNKFIEELNKISLDNKNENKSINTCLNALTLNIETHVQQKDELIRLTTNNLELLKQRDATIVELFNMLKEQIKVNKNGKMI